MLVLLFLFGTPLLILYWCGLHKTLAAVGSFIFSLFVYCFFTAVGFIVTAMFMPFTGANPFLKMSKIESATYNMIQSADNFAQIMGALYLIPYDIVVVFTKAVFEIHTFPAYLFWGIGLLGFIVLMLSSIGILIGSNRR